MRVVIAGDYPLNPSRIWGGVEAAFAYLVRGLSHIEDLELHVLTLGDALGANPDQLHTSGLRVHILPPFQRLEFARNFRSYQAIFDATLSKIQPDVLHAQGATDHAYVALRSGYPTVITVHGIQSEDSKHQGNLRNRTRKWIYSHLIERHNLSHTPNLIAISRYVTQYFGSVLRDTTRIYYIPNAIDDSFFNLESAAQGQTILYAGRIIRRKRTLDLIKAFAQIAPQLPDAQLRLAGEYDSEPGYAERVRALVAQERLHDRVHLLGGLGEAEILEEFARCDVLVLPSIQETTPMVIAQAMACGKPVVATPVGGVPEMVRDGETGFLIEVGEPERMADVLLRLLCEPHLRWKMGQAARAFALANYHAASVAQRTFEVYRTIQQEGNRPRSHPAAVALGDLRA